MTINNSNNFTEDLFKEILLKGFGTMSKKDIDILLMHLLFKDKQFSSDEDHYTIAKILKTTPAKVRNLIYDMQLRYDNEELNIQEILLTMLLNKKYIVDGNFIILEIRNPQYKDLFEYEVRNVGGFSDGSFNNNIIKLKKEAFEKLFNSFFDGFDLEKIKKELSKKELEELKSINPKDSGEFIFSLLKIFGESTAKQLGKETAKILPDIITGGFTNGIKFIKYLLSE